MFASSTSNYYSALPTHRLPLSRLLDDESLFAAAPADWHVVVTDVKNSTKAFVDGRHEEVNLIATGSIIAALNLAYKSNVEIPFFFGGDGATLVVPQELHDAVIRSLTIHRRNTLENFGFDLRLGSVPVSNLYAAGHELNIARLYVSDFFSIPALLGSGLSEAERIVKQDDDVRYDVGAADEELDLEGMECRWDRVEPRMPSHEVVSLVVTAGENQRQGPVFSRVVHMIDQIYGPPEFRNPVSVNKLKLNRLKISLETRVRRGRWDLSYFLKNWLVTLFGSFYYLQSDAGRHYTKQLVDLTDTLVIDGRINTVIAGTDIQRRELDRQLSLMEKEGLITFGLFVSRESVMSCYVRDRQDKHIHFVDGSDGGYTMAASMWKRKMRRET